MAGWIWPKRLPRRRWHPTPVLLPGKSHGGGAWWAAVHGVAKSRARLSEFTFTFHSLEKEMATHSSVLAWRILGTGEPGGLPSKGSHRVGHNWSDLAAAAAEITGATLETISEKCHCFCCSGLTLFSLDSAVFTWPVFSFAFGFPSFHSYL